MSSLEGLSGVVAFVLAVFLAPPVTDLTLPWVLSLFTDLYGSGLGYLISQGWILVCGIALYFICRAVLSLALATASSAAMLRFFPA